MKLLLLIFLFSDTRFGITIIYEVTKLVLIVYTSTTGPFIFVPEKLSFFDLDNIFFAKVYSVIYCNNRRFFHLLDTELLSFVKLFFHRCF